MSTDPGMATSSANVQEGQDAALAAFNFAHTLPVVLEMITHYLSGVDILALCQTCSQGLFFRLRVGGVKRFEVTATTPVNWSGVQYGWIRLLPRLETLILTSSTLSLWKAGPTVFDFFPSTLKTLAIRLPILFGDWLMTSPKKIKQPLSIQSNRKHARAHMTPKEKQPTHCIYDFQIAKQLPVLQELSISGGVMYNGYSVKETNNSSTAARKDARNRFVLSLPLSLTKISLPDLQEWTWDAYQRLPHSLVDLSLICHDVTVPDSGFDLLPRNLTSLNVDTPFCTVVTTHALFPNLPPDLTHLSWNAGSLRSADIVSSIFGGLAEHPNLISMSLDFSCCPIADDIFTVLPPRLESLEVRLFASLLPSFTTFANLPRTLTKFILRSVRTIGRHGFLPSLGYDAFPPTLTFLELGSYAVFTDDEFSHLPSSLVHLDIRFNTASFTNHVCDDDCSAHCKAALREAPDRSPYLLTDEAVLPPNLTFLRFTGTSFSDGFFSKLPETLKTLEIETDAKCSSACFNQLPNLTTLIVSRGPHIPPLSYCELPRSLLHLSTDEKLMSSFVLRTLPPGLQTLRISELATITNDDIAVLPRGLIELKLPKSDLSSDCATHIPRSLKLLEVHKIQLATPRPPTAQLIRDMPQELDIFSLPWVNQKGRQVDVKPGK